MKNNTFYLIIFFIMLYSFVILCKIGLPQTHTSSISAEMFTSIMPGQSQLHFVNPSAIGISKSINLSLQTKSMKDFIIGLEAPAYKGLNFGVTHFVRRSDSIQITNAVAAYTIPFKVFDTDYKLIPSAEVSLISLYKSEHIYAYSGGLIFMGEYFNSGMHAKSLSTLIKDDTTSDYPFSMSGHLSYKLNWKLWEIAPVIHMNYSGEAYNMLNYAHFGCAFFKNKLGLQYLLGSTNFIYNGDLSERAHIISLSYENEHIAFVLHTKNLLPYFLGINYKFNRVEKQNNFWDRLMWMQ